ncbi:uncharacterized protein LOC124143888 [Haliotis rufescens]|uniref:uncharacterized protein LOC124143888 n=1 Tax=Haliotis rufescens TaxID=6454 RepID=UPI00201F87F9|nr:uncharacterized protein LOC124143888 [Haliotis rufescens]
MKAALSVLLVFVALSGSSVVQGLRKSSLEIELKSLKKLFEAAIKQMRTVDTSVAEFCPACEDECADDCLTKLLRRFEERLQRLQEVISKLEKLACHECPGEFWTDAAIITPDSILRPRETPVAQAPSLTDFGGVSAMSNAFTSRKSVVVATNEHIYRDAPAVDVSAGKTILAISYDRVSNSLYSVEEADDDSITIVRRDVDGSNEADIRTYTAQHAPVDLTFDNSGVMYVLLTEGNSNYIEQIENVTTTPVVTNMGASLGHGRRLAIDSANRIIYYTSSTGVSAFDISANTHTKISDATSAVGIGYEAEDETVVYCFSDSGDVVAYNPAAQTSNTTSHEGNGCSDLAVNNLLTNSVTAQTAGVSNVLVYITANDKNEVFVCSLDSQTGVPQMTSVFETDSTLTSITLV